VRSIESTSRLRRWSSVVSMILLRRTCHHRLIVSQTWILDVGLGHQLWHRYPFSTAVRIGYRWRSLVSGHWTTNMEQFTSINTLSPNLLSFKRQLKTRLFSRRYIWHCLSKPNIVDLAVFFNLGHFKKLLYITLREIYNTIQYNTIQKDCH